MYLEKFYLLFIY